MSAAQVQALLGGAQLLLRAPENVDQDENIDLSVKLTVEQPDTDSTAIDTAEITGTLNVRIVAAVEDDGSIELVNSSDDPLSTTVSDNGTGTISLAAADQHLAFITPEGVNTDGNSAEIITQVVVTFLKDAQGTPLTLADQAFFDQFTVAGGINNGDGSWTVPESALSSLAISTTVPISTPVYIKVTARVQDQGDAGEGDVSAQVEQTPLILTLDFQGSVDNNQQAGDITVTPQDITGVEDKAINLGDQLDGQISVEALHVSDDELTLVISSGDLAAIGGTVSGMDFNFATGEYVVKVPVGSDGSVDLSSVSLHLPEHFAGDVSLPIKLVTTDLLSGHVKEVSTTLSVLVTPVVDGVTTSVSVVETNGLDSEEQPTDNQTDWVPVAGKALEDGIIELDFSAKLIDPDTSPTSGVESVTSVVLSVDTSMGFFVDANGENPQSSISVSVSELSSIHFKPAKDFSGNVSVSMATTVEDKAVNDDTGEPDSIVTDTVNSSVSFEVQPVNDPVTFSGNTTPISGNEDSAIPLTGVMAQLNDTDGSEKIYSIRLVGVPDDFQVISTGSQLVQNSGSGIWTVSVPAGAQSLNLDSIAFVPPENFSGKMTVELVVFAGETALDAPEAYKTSIDVVVNPVGDGVDAEITPSVAGSEDDNIVLPLDISVVDNKPTYDGTGLSVTENEPETIKVVLTNVPDSASISLPTGVAPGSSAEKQSDGSWVIIANQSTLSSLIFTPGDANTLNWDGKLEISVRAVDNGVEAESSLWVNQTIDVTVSPVNDAPELTAPATVNAEEDTPLLIESIQVKDVDASEQAGNAVTVRLSAIDGVIGLPSTTPLPPGVTVTGQDSGTMILNGTLDDINAVLSGGVTYLGDTNFSGQDTVTVVVNDNGSTGSGGALRDTASITVNVAPKPDIPTLTLNAAQTAAAAGSISALIPLLGLAAALTDPSETLSVEIRNIPAGLTFTDADGAAMGTGPVNGVLTLTADELSQLHVTGSAVLSQQVEVVAISETSTGETQNQYLFPCR